MSVHENLSQTSFWNRGGKKIWMSASLLFTRIRAVIECEKKNRKISSYFIEKFLQLCPLTDLSVFFVIISFCDHSGLPLWCDFQCLTSDYSHSFSLCSLKTLQWFVRRPDEDGLSASLLKQWSNMKDYIKDVSLPPTFLIVHCVVCLSH